MNRLAIIPARGGSKRFPRKNIAMFNELPIIAHTIQAAIASGQFSDVVVSSDDPEILHLAERYGATTHRRPAELATDSARVKDVCFHYLQSRIESGYHFDVLCVLYATAPLRNAEDIRGVVSLIGEGCDSALAVTGFDLPVHQALILGEDNKAEPAFPQLIEKRESEVPRFVVDNGSTYAVDVASFLTHRTFVTPQLKVYEMPRERSVDLDYPEDFELLKFYSAMQDRKK